MTARPLRRFRYNRSVSRFSRTSRSPAPRRFRRRDSIVALFWPDLDDSHARGALRQALSYLRRELGANALNTHGEEEIALDPEEIRSDAVAFEEALASGRHESAMPLYGGDFLEGLFISDASAELEEWLEAERGRFRALAARSCSSISASKRDGSDWAAAAEWGRRAVALVPTTRESYAA